MLDISDQAEKERGHDEMRAEHLRQRSHQCSVYEGGGGHLEGKGTAATTTGMGCGSRKTDVGVQRTLEGVSVLVVTIQTTKAIC